MITTKWISKKLQKLLDEEERRQEKLTWEICKARHKVAEKYDRYFNAGDK